MKNLSIKQKLLLAFFLISFVPFFVISHLNIAAVKKSLFNSEIQKLLAGANLTAEKINSFITTNTNSISREAQFPTYAAFIEANTPRSKELLKHAAMLVKLCCRKQYEIYIQYYFITGISGEVLFSSDPSIEGVSFAGHSFIDDVFKSGIPQSILYVKGPLAGVYFSAPVKNEKNDIIGLVCIKYNFSILQHMVSNCNDIAGEESFAVLIDKDGICVASGKYPDLIGKNLEGTLKINGGINKNESETGAGIIYNENDIYKINDEYYHYAGDMLIKNKYSKVFFLQPAGKFYKIVGKQLDIILFFSLLVLIVSFGGGWFIWKKLVDPIENLTKAVKNFSLDSPEPGVKIISNDEIGTLAASFNQMSERLKAAHEKLKESEKKWEFAIIGSGDGVWDWNVKTNKIFLSKRWKEMFKIDIEEDIVDASSVSFFMHPDDKSEMWEKINACVKGEIESFSSEHRVLLKDGSIRWTLARGRTVSYGEDGMPLRFIGTNTDITARKEAEENYKKARDLAQKANELKTQFLANMSHEIRTPMNGIIGFTKLLLMSDLKTDQKEHINIIKMSSEHLLNIINDILDFSKLEAGKFKIVNESFSFDEFISKVNDFARPLFFNKNIEFNLSVADELKNINIVADPLRLNQILINLISNAAKFTERGSVSLCVEKIQSGDPDEKLKFVISDTGIGIEAAKVNEIFNAFHQLDGSYTKKFSGTGLGLAIVKELVGLMRGEIRVESELDRGSVFTFEIPFSPHSRPKEDKLYQDARSRPLEAARSYNGLKALVADDDGTSRLLIKTLLETRGFDVMTAENGREAVEMFENEKIDLIIMDIQMPELDGVGAIKAIRRKDAATGKKTPIIVASAYAGKDEQQSFADCGADECVSKPIEFDNFWAHVKVHIDK
ncbi:MAG TPA: ATP-binding protein [Candidatus Wallbacteria bacterium]|nr:ATP-binding protein [Candidatus Wallbacteria bacterium]